MSMERLVNLGGQTLPALGLGTWYLGDDPAVRDREIQALRAGIEAGARLIDTAEMYGGGRSELLVGEAIRPYQREELYLVSKVLPSNAGQNRIRRACEQSLRRLGTDYLDLYLYHWIGSVPLPEVVAGLEDLQKAGLIRRWGVSNFDVQDMQALWRVPGGKNCLVNQVLYHLGSRGVEYSLLPWMREHDVRLMAYCPLAQGGSLRRGLMKNEAVLSVAKKHGCTPAEVLLSFVLRDGNTVAIPRSGKPEHTLENMAADKIRLDEEDLRLLSRAYPAPTKKEWLDMQ